MKQYFSVLVNRRPVGRKTVSFAGIRSLSLPFLSLVLVLTAAPTQAQTSNEFFSSSYSGAIPNGPTASSQTARLTLNDNNPVGDTVGATSVNVSVTASLSNQQFTGFSTGAGNPVVMFGATLTGSGSGGPTSIPVFGPMNGVGGGTSGQFSNTPSGTAQGLNVAVNQAFDIFASVRHWASGSPPATTARVHMADLTLTFSSPVTNPRVHFMGMGGTFSGLGFSSEFTLITPGLTLTKIQGNTDLVITGNQINNGNATIDASCAAAAGCGTVTVNGSNITTVTFQVYIRGDGATAVWSGTTTHPGDRFLVAVSLPESYTLSGNVFNDTDGAGTINGTGIGSPSGTQLYANLIDPTDNSVIGSVAVNPDGTFSFPGVPGTGVNYQVQISTIQGTVFSPAPVRVLPSGWVSVGENLGPGAGNDGTADRNLSVTVGSAAPASTNFGITAGPTAADVTIAGRVTTADGRGIRNVTIRLTQGDGTVLTTISSAFGYYSFNNVPAGHPVLVTVNAKRFRFANPSIFVDAFDSFTDVNFVASE
jgi:hypothetical protein